MVHIVRNFFTCRDMFLVSHIPGSHKLINDHIMGSKNRSLAAHRAGLYNIYLIIQRKIRYIYLPMRI